MRQPLGSELPNYFIASIEWAARSYLYGCSTHLREYFTVDSAVCLYHYVFPLKALDSFQSSNLGKQGFAQNERRECRKWFASISGRYD